MKTLSRLIAFFFLIQVSSPAWAQFVLSGEIRPRAELRHGFGKPATPDFESAFFTSQRSRLTANYRSEQVVTRLVLQDVRVWGNQTQMVGNEDLATSIHEAWGMVVLGKGFSAKLGRQEIAYDDHRVFGNVEWADQARSHDALLLQYEGAITAHLGVAFNQQGVALEGRDYAVPGNYKDMEYLWLHHDGEQLKASLLLLNLGNQRLPDPLTGEEPSTQHSQTAGVHLEWKAGHFQLLGSAYAQTGSDVAKRDVAASQLMAEAVYKPGKFGAALFVERLSGNDQDGPADENHAFAPYFGTNHKFNGHMDYFYVGNHANSVGLRDFGFRLLYAHEGFSAYLHGHQFMADAKVLDPLTGQEADAALGQELDLALTWTVNPVAKLTLGYSFYLPTTTLELLKATPDSQTSYWAWAMLAIKPTFFSTAD